MSKERPILFSGDMVKAILDGRKTQTRRVMNPQPITPTFGAEIGEFGEHFAYNEWTCPQIDVIGLSWKEAKKHRRNIKCPYGKVGDRLWVRETWHIWGIPDKWQFYDYRATCPDPENYRWKPSIFMPRAASRILLEVTGVRVERVQDITEADAKAEGYPAGCEMSPIDWFMTLWDSINAKRGYGWNRNPFNWVVDYKRIANEEAAAAEVVAGEG